MAYGNIRAVLLQPTILKQLELKTGCLCVPCIGKLIQGRKLKLTKYYEKVYAGEERELLSGEKAVDRNMLLGVQSTYHEGQLGHQNYLDSHYCVKCGDVLRKHCTDY